MSRAHVHVHMLRDMHTNQAYTRLMADANVNDAGIYAKSFAKVIDLAVCLHHNQLQLHDCDAPSETCLVLSGKLLQLFLMYVKQAVT